VYAHIPTYISDPGNLEAIAEKKLIASGGAIVPQDEFQRIVDMSDDKNVFVVDYRAIQNAQVGQIRIEDALKHPHVIPFLGGKERAAKYLEACNYYLAGITGRMKNSIGLRFSKYLLLEHSRGFFLNAGFRGDWSLNADFDIEHYPGFFMGSFTGEKSARERKQLKPGILLPDDMRSRLSKEGDESNAGVESADKINKDENKDREPGDCSWFNE
jgi:hypothetical protein